MSNLNQDRVKQFAGKMVGILNSGMLAIMISVGRQTGLFETLAGLPPSTSEEIAKAGALNERYVREWLASMVTGGIVEYDEESQTYTLPREHAAVVTKAAGPRDMSRFMQYLPMLAEVEQDIIECFHRGGGLPYDKYPRFLTLMSESSGLRFDDLLVQKVIPLIGLTEKLESGINVLDIGCGNGRASNVLAQAFPNSNFVGFDFLPKGVEAAEAEMASMGHTNARFEVKDIAALNQPEQYDFITTFDVIHDQAKPELVLREVYRALSSGGTFLMVDIKASSHLHDNINHPMAPFLYGISTMHCTTVSLSMDGPGLGCVWGEQVATSMLEEAGFKDVTVHTLPEDAINNYYLAKK
jgi:ubiquinone/menaquinone biosynthesis C-methylase UbiE